MKKFVLLNKLCGYIKLINFVESLKVWKNWKKPKYNFWINKCLGFLYIYFDICT